MNGCEIIKCPYYRDNICINEAEYIDGNDGEPCCPFNPNAILKTEINFTYLMQPSKRYTFEQPKLKQWVELWCRGKVLNLFAGKVRLNVDEARNDIDLSMNADYYWDAFQFVANWKGKKFDTVILDPPYTYRKAKELYNNHLMGQLPRLKNKLLSILNDKARVISLGYDSVGMSTKRGFKKIAICLVCHSGDSKDTIALVEQRIKNTTLNLL